MYNQKNRNVLTTEQLLRAAPAIFTDSAAENTSNRYTVIPTIDIINGMQRADFLPVFAMQQNSKNSVHAKHLVKFMHRSAMEHDAKQVPEILLINSHDGKSSYQLKSGFYRFICSNGLVVAENEKTEARIRHMGDIIGQVVESSSKIVEELPETGRLIDVFDYTVLNTDEQMALADAAHLMLYGSKESQKESGKFAPIESNQLLRAWRHADKAPTLWNTFNVIQENVIKGGLRGKTYNEEGRLTGYRKTRKVTSIDKNTQLNQALWSLTEKMAELKGTL